MNAKTFWIELENAVALGLAEGKKTHKELAEEFGVCEDTILSIAKRRKLHRKRGAGSPAYKYKQARKQQAV